MAERRKRLTASNVGSIAKMRKTTKRSSKVQSLLYSSFRGNQATRYGSANEDSARQQYIADLVCEGHEVEVKECGMFISLPSPWLAASPDGIICDQMDSSNILGLLEIKCPFNARDKTVAEACKSSSFCLQENSLKLKPRHDYFYQVQCQLHCVDCEWCDFQFKTVK